MTEPVKLQELVKFNRNGVQYGTTLLDLFEDRADERYDPPKIVRGPHTGYLGIKLDNGQIIFVAQGDLSALSDEEAGNMRQKELEAGVALDASRSELWSGKGGPTVYTPTW